MYFNNKAVDFTSQSHGIILILTNQSVFPGLLSLAAKRRAFKMGLTLANVNLKNRESLYPHVPEQIRAFWTTLRWKSRD